MNFCMETDAYISRYIDDLLNESQKEQLLKHIEGCGACAKKFRETTLIAELCRQSEDIQLPADFSSSLHKRLVEVNAGENHSKRKIFLFDKKWIASLSTAAILVISLLAYNLLPQVEYKKSDTGQAENAITAQMAGGSEPEISGFGGQRSSVESAMNEAAASSREDAADDKEFAYNAASLKEPVSESNADTYIDSGPKENLSGSPEAGASAAPSSELKMTAKKSQETSNDNGSINPQSASDTERGKSDATLPEENGKEIYAIMGTRQKYFSGCAELSLQVTEENTEIDQLKQLLEDLGAVEIPEDAAENSEEQELQKPEYVDYSLAWNQYSELLSKAADMYHLRLTVLTDIIQTDATEEYNELTSIKAELDAKIEEKKAAGEDTALLETEQKELTEQINNILVKNGIISVRIFIDR